MVSAIPATAKAIITISEFIPPPSLNATRSQKYGPRHILQEKQFHLGASAPAYSRISLKSVSRSSEKAQESSHETAHRRIIGTGHRSPRRLARRALSTARKVPG